LILWLGAVVAVGVGAFLALAGEFSAFVWEGTPCWGHVINILQLVVAFAAWTVSLWFGYALVVVAKGRRISRMWMPLAAFPTLLGAWFAIVELASLGMC
jgi:hypothetical protein